MRRKLAVVMTLAAFASVAAAQDYPPRAKLYLRAKVGEAGERPAAVGFLGAFGIQRGYVAAVFAVDPADPARGSRVVSYDTGQEKAVVLIEDLNALCGQETRPGVRGQRLRAFLPEGRGMMAGLIGTGAAPGEGAFPGGHVLRDQKDLGAVEAGWSVARFLPDWRGRLWLADEGDNACRLAVASSPDGKRHRLYGVLADRIADLGIESAREDGFFIQRNEVIWPAPEGGWMGKSLVAATPPAALRDAAPVGPPPPPEGVRPAVIASARIGRFGEGAAPLLERLRLAEGYSIFARDGADGAAARLFCRIGQAARLGEAAPADLGPLPDFDGVPLTSVHGVALNGLNELFVLAANDRGVVVDVYDPPMIEALTALRNADFDFAVAQSGLPPLPMRTIESLYRYAAHADRGFNAMHGASDGRIYFGTMPHHPTRGTPIFRYDPDAATLEVLGNFDELAGNAGPGRIPNMMHTEPLEMNGRLYFTGQDPFYGNYSFPGMTPENTTYVGSPVLAYDLKTGAFTNLGVPLPRIPGQRGSVFGIEGDAARNILYLRPGYESGDWYSWPLDAEGQPAGEAKKLDLIGPPVDVHAFDGALYYPAPAQPAVEGVPDPPDAPAPWAVWRYDLATGRNSRIAEVDAVKLHGAAFPLKRDGRIRNEFSWFEGTRHEPAVFGKIGAVGMVIRFDARDGSVRKVGMLAPAATEYPVSTPYGKVHAGRIYFPTGRVRGLLGLTVLDTETGALTEYGPLRDQHGRWVSQITEMGWDKAGRLYGNATVFGAPGDEFFHRRTYGGGPGKVDSVLMAIDRLPPAP